ncbi:hypothetical protein [Allosalinactinospora lopnorensis]|uniref:hypothetical protein n=1 Tax=Allosalinactinospora lopnorensis TaxID=1352348 RepID=UPI000AF904C6|nr:hypothetical protein [Allosalinactinospora lopnorensis]
MTDVSTLPAPSIPQAWDCVDTSIDAETPELLSEEQFDRYTETVTAPLTAAGLTVHGLSEREPGRWRSPTPQPATPSNSTCVTTAAPSGASPSAARSPKAPPR